MSNRLNLFVVLLSFFAFTFQTEASYIKANLGAATIDGMFGAGDGNTGMGFNLKTKAKVLSPITFIYGINLSDSFSLEIDAGYRNNELDFDAIDAKVKVLNLGLSAVHWFSTASKVKPYLGTGLAVAQYDVSSATNEDDAIALAVQAFGGANFQINEEWGVGVDARYFSSLLGPSLNFGTDIDGTYHLFTLALTGTYTF